VGGGSNFGPTREHLNKNPGRKTRSESIGGPRGEGRQKKLGSSEAFHSYRSGLTQKSLGGRIDTTNL